MVGLARALTLVAALGMAAGGTVAPPPAQAGAAAAADPVLTATLDRVSAKVLEYYERVRSIVATETVRMQQLSDGLTPSGFPRRLVYELRIEWSTPADRDQRPVPNVVRRLLTVNGSQPRPSDEPACEDPRSGLPEPLFLLLPEHRGEYGFSLGRPQRVDDRTATTIDYISLPTGIQPTWKKDCVTIPLEGRTRGRIWVDADTDVVMKLEERLVGMVDVRVPREYSRFSGSVMTLDRADFFVQYAPVRFTDPDETVTLPASIESMRVFRGSGVSRMRVTQTYSGYQRFLTDSRVIRRPVEETR